MSSDDYQPDTLETTEGLTESRQQTINEARKRLLEIRNKTAQARQSEEAALAYREALMTYLLEIRQWRDVAGEASRKYWTGGHGGEGDEDDYIRLGWVTATPPPPDAPEWWADRGNDFGVPTPEWAHDPDRVKQKSTYYDMDRQLLAEIAGLDDILHEQPHEAEFRWEYNHHWKGTQTLRTTVAVPIPRQILDRALEWAADYTREIGLDIDVTDTVDVEASPI